MSNSEKRIRFNVDKLADEHIRDAAERSGRTVSELIRNVIVESTHGLTDFSIIDNADFSNRVTKPRYHSVESRMSTNEQVGLLTNAARKRGRTLPALIYHIISLATQGFTQFNGIGEETS